MLDCHDGIDEVQHTCASPQMAGIGFDRANVTRITFRQTSSRPVDVCRNSPLYGIANSD